MKDQILFINACVRPESRTAELTRHPLDRLDGEITEVDLYKENEELLKIIVSSITTMKGRMNNK